MLEYLIGSYLFLRVYNKIHFYLIRKRARNPTKLMPGAEPFLVKGGKTGILFIHGFTSTPQEFRNASVFLNKKGYTIYAPLLPGHGTRSEKLLLVKWQDYIEKISQDIKLLSDVCDEIYLVGSSFGGIIAMSLPKNEKVKGIVVCGSPIFFKNYKIRRILLAVMNNIKNFVTKRYQKLVKQRKLDKNFVCYQSVPISSLYHLLKIINYTKKRINKVKTPILIVQSKIDAVVDKKSVSYIYNNVKSKQKYVFWVPDSYHNVMIDKYQNQVYDKINLFIEKTRKKD